jgi:starch-binding outer membrane protein, SusD/RagB family
MSPRNPVFRPTAPRRRLPLGRAAVLGLVLVLPACDSLLEVELPTRLPAATLDDPRLGKTLVEGAVADFECALVNYIAATGLLTDELYDSTGWIAVTTWDQRRVFPDNGNLGTAACTSLGYGVYRTLHTARFQSEDALRRLEAWTDAEVANRTALMAEAALHAAFSLTMLGEAFCEMAIDEGPLMTPAQVLGVAEERFTRALDLAGQAGNATLANAARVGRARVRLDLGNRAGAATDAREVPAGFVLNATYSAANNRRWNRIYDDNYRNLYISVHPSFRGLQVEGVPDTRVAVVDAGRNGHDGVTRVWQQQKYTAVGSPIPIASWREAQLILAEAVGGAEAVSAINALRASASLPAYGGGSDAEVAEQVKEERRRELYLQGHRLNDMLRFAIPFEPGATHKGVAYGPTTCLPLPDAERQNNPNLAG